MNFKKAENQMYVRIISEKNKNGITLIALVITIIVILVLTGVVINLSMGENGIIGKAKTAVDKYKQAEEKEQVFLGKMQNAILSDRTTVTIDKETYDALVEDVNALKKEVRILKKINTEFQSGSGTISYLENEDKTLKSFTNLTPGLYYVSISCWGQGNVTDNVSIWLNSNRIAISSASGGTGGSAKPFVSKIVEISDESDVIYLHNFCANKSTDTREFDWELLRIR